MAAGRIFQFTCLFQDRSLLGLNKRRPLLLFHKAINLFHVSSIQPSLVSTGNFFSEGHFHPYKNSLTGIPYLLAKSKSLSSCPGTAITLPVPYDAMTKLLPNRNLFSGEWMDCRPRGNSFFLIHIFVRSNSVIIETSSYSSFTLIHIHFFYQFFCNWMFRCKR